MASDVVITIINNVIVFSCPSCNKTGGFPLALIREMSGETISYPCGHCNAEAAFDSARIEGTVRLMKKDDPGLKGPFEVKFTEGSLIGGGSGSGGAGAADRDVIVVIDSDESFRTDIGTIFEGLARVEAYGGSKGAAEFIVSHAQGAILMIIDVYLGDGTFIDILGAIKANEKAAGISTILVHPTRKDRVIIEQMVLPFPQVKRIIHKDDLLKRLAEVADKFPGRGK
ncbi:MAG: hypothetical protein JW765_07885 [Deltaproteobacteria bacterium]|nr:hypothetical protein [Candidatus Zymogenaceae bacterium]